MSAATASRQIPAWKRGLLMLAALVAVLLGSLATIPSASAAAAPVPSAVNIRTDDRGASCSSAGSLAEHYLPVQRWSDHTKFHSREGWGLGGVMDAPMETIVSMGIGMGNMAWSVSSYIVEFANRFCPVDAVGGVMDSAFHDIAKGIIDSALLTVLFIASAIAWLWRVATAEGGRLTKMMFQRLAVAGLFVIMATGAANSTGGGISGPPDKGRMLGDTVDPTPTEYSGFTPGVGSPGWFITSIDTVTSEMSRGIVSSISGSPTVKDDSSAAHLVPYYNPRSPYSCETYVNTLEKEYLRLTRGDDASGTSVALALNGFWKQSGLPAWKRIQFGANNNYGNIVWCRMLEENRATRAMREAGSSQYDEALSEAGRTVKVSDATMSIAAGVGGKQSDDQITGGKNIKKLHDSPMWNTGGSAAAISAKMVAWAACRNDGASGEGMKDSSLGWSVPKNRLVLFRDDPDSNRILGTLENWGEKLTGSKENTGSKSDAEKSCAALFAGDANELKRWDWGDGKSNVDNMSSAEGSAQANEFLRHLHGSKGFDGLIIALSYAAGAFAMLFVFGSFAVSIIFAKLLGLMMIIGVMGTLIMALTPNGDISRVGRFFKQYVGISFYAFAAGVLLSILTLITGVLIAIGNSTMQGPTIGVLNLLWIGFAPLIAMFTLWYLFKKMGMPSPISLKGATSWGQAAAGGNLGNAVAGGVAGGATAGLASKWANRGKGAMKDKAKSMLPGAHKVKDGAGKQELDPSKRGGDAPAADSKGVAGQSKKAKGTDSDGAAAVGAGALAGGVLTRDEKKKAKAEEKDAEAGAREAWKGSVAGAQAQRGATGKALWAGRASAAKDAVKKRIKDVGSSTMKGLKEKPLRTVAKGGLYAAGGAVALAAGPLAALAVGGAGLVGRKNLAEGAKSGIRSAGATIAGGVSGAREELKAAGERGEDVKLADVVGRARERSAENRAWQTERAEEMQRHAEETASLQVEQQKRRDADNERLLAEQQKLRPKKEEPKPKPDPGDDSSGPTAPDEKPRQEPKPRGTSI